MSKRKIFNDPIYGLLYFPYDFIYELIDHPYFQRLRRISQMGLCNYIFPGAHHTRFHHAIGAVSLMLKALETLKSKGVSITEEECEAACAAILLHDIGHGPFSHALEHRIVKNHHESLSLLIMKHLNQEYSGRLDLAISIFTGQYEKHFLHQLVSSQLDVDRLDYLTRDSFYTGVAEGVIGYDRIIKMLNVVDNQIVVEEKAVYSIEKFLVSRRIMYWQVYLHKTSVAVELMLERYIQMIKEKSNLIDFQRFISPNLQYFIQKPDFEISTDHDLEVFMKIDDIDVLQSIKNTISLDNFNISYLSKCLIIRRLFGILQSDSEFPSDLILQQRQKVVDLLKIEESEVDELLIESKVKIQVYDAANDGIKFLLKTGDIVDYSDYNHQVVSNDTNTKYFLCFPKYKA